MYFAETPAAETEELDGFALFFSQYGLLILLLLVLVFMFWSSRKRTQRMRDEQEKKRQAMVPGVKVLLQGGIYGTLVEYDADDLSKAARVEIAPGVEMEVHSQGILRAVDPEPDEQFTEDDFIESEPAATSEADVTDSVPDDASDLTVDPRREGDDKPKS